MDHFGSLNGSLCTCPTWRPRFHHDIFVFLSGLDLRHIYVLYTTYITVDHCTHVSYFLLTFFSLYIYIYVFICIYIYIYHTCIYVYIYVCIHMIHTFIHTRIDVDGPFSPRMVWMRRTIRWWCSLQPTMLEEPPVFLYDGWEMVIQWLMMVNELMNASFGL